MLISTCMCITRPSVCTIDTACVLHQIVIVIIIVFHGITCSFTKCSSTVVVIVISATLSVELACKQFGDLIIYDANITQDGFNLRITCSHGNMIKVP